MMRSALIGMLLVLPAAIAYSSGSAYASGASSAYASKAYVSASATGKAPAPAPAPAPAGTVAKKINTITATISLAGVPASAFNKDTEAGKKVRLAFQKTVAKSFKLRGEESGVGAGRGGGHLVLLCRRRRDRLRVELLPSRRRAPLHVLLEYIRGRQDVHVRVETNAVSQHHRRGGLFWRLLDVLRWVSDTSDIMRKRLWLIRE